MSCPLDVAFTPPTLVITPERYEQYGHLTLNELLQDQFWQTGIQFEEWLRWRKNQ